MSSNVSKIETGLLVDYVGRPRNGKQLVRSFVTTIARLLSGLAVVSAVWLIPVCAADEAALLYLKRDHFDSAPSEPELFEDDVLLHLREDLNNDGKPEVLLSLMRYVDGRAGNVWVAYESSPTGYRKMGNLTFRADQYYVGWIEEIASYGLVSFWPSGQEGSLLSYVVDPEAKAVRMGVLGRVTYEPDADKVVGREIVEKYFPANSNLPNSTISRLGVKEIQRKVSELELAPGPALTPTAESPGILKSGEPSTTVRDEDPSNEAGGKDGLTDRQAAREAFPASRSLVLKIGGLIVLIAVSLYAWRRRRGNK